MPVTQYEPQRKPVSFWEAAARGLAASNSGPRLNIGPILGALFPATRNAMANSDYENAVQSQMRSQAAQEMMKLAPHVTEQGIAEAGFGTAKAQSGVRQLPTAEAANIAQQRFNQGQSEMGARLLSPLEDMTAAKYGLGKKEAESQGRLMVGAETAQDKINKSHELAAQGAIFARRSFCVVGVMWPFVEHNFMKIKKR